MTDMYWEHFYKKSTILKPSKFSKYCMSFIKTYYSNIGNLTLIDLGCNNGLDCLYFAKNGIKVIGIDKCKEIIDINNKFSHIDLNYDLNYVVDNFVNTNFVADIYYSSFSIHSISINDFNIFCENQFNKMKNGDLFFIESISIKDFDSENKLEYYEYYQTNKNHYRILYSLDYLKQKLTNIGFKILNEREDRGLAKFTQNPYIVQLVCTKYDSCHIDSISKLLNNTITPYHITWQKNIIRLFSNVVDHLYKFGISYWLCNSSLLGFLRYGNMIPWCEKIEIMIDFKDIQQLKKSVMNTKYQLIKVNSCYKFTAEKIQVDIFIIDFSISTEMKFNEVYPLKTGIFCDIECNIPNLYFDYLNRRYGCVNTCMVPKFANNIITHEDCDKIINAINTQIKENTKRSTDIINNFKQNSCKLSIVLSCVYNSELDMFLNHLSNVLIFNPSITIIYKIKKSLFNTIVQHNLIIPDNVLFNDIFIDEFQMDIEELNNKLLLHHIDNYKYINNLVEYSDHGLISKIQYEYFGLISQNTYFIKPIDAKVSLELHKINIHLDQWKNQYIRKDKYIMNYKDLYAGQLDGTMLPKEVFGLAFNNIIFDNDLQDYPYHEVYIPTLTYRYLQDQPNKCFCKICWPCEHNTVLLDDIESLYNDSSYTAVYISDCIPYNDARRIYIDSIKTAESDIIVLIVSFDGTSKRFAIRNITVSDYEAYLKLLKQFACTNPLSTNDSLILDESKHIHQSNIFVDDFNYFVSNHGNNHNILVIEDIDLKVIIGSGTLLVEQELHNMDSIGHILDLVIDHKYSGCGLGNLLIDMLVQLSKELDCYKVILNCDSDCVNFYEKGGFVKKDVEMVHYNKPNSQ